MTPPSITRTRQDLINTGEAFGKTMNEQFRGSNSSGLSRHSSSSSTHKSDGKRRLNEFCYSISNLVIIVSAVIALCVLIKFIQDDPLYEYGEHVLSLRFYRELIFIIVLMPLVLLLPVFNALAALLLSSSARQSESLTRLKLGYQVVLFLLVLLALIFMAPYIRASNLSSQIDLELRKHLKYRYDKQFSHELLDAIQETYECCDELWYRANYGDSLPVSCFVPNGRLNEIFDQTCANALGSLVSVRCSIIAACLLILLICLASLFAIDLIHLISHSSNGGHSSSNYRVQNAQTAHKQQRVGSFQRRREDQLDEDDEHQNQRQQQRRVRDHEHELSAASSSGQHSIEPLVTTPMIGGRDDPISELLRKEFNGSSSVLPSGQNRLNSNERQQQVPLLNRSEKVSDQQFDQLDNDDETMPRGPTLTSRQYRQANTTRPHRTRESESPDYFGAIDDNDNHNDDHSQQQEDDDVPNGFKREPVVWARANLRMVEQERSRSPLFKTVSRELDSPTPTPTTTTTNHPPAIAPKPPIKSALKKTSSSQHVDSTTTTASPSAADNDSGSYHFRRDSADADSLDDYAEKLRQSNSLLRQKSLQREQPTRRSLLSVRFAE